jgi:hypothetical protein
MKITKTQLIEMVKKEVLKLNKISIMESRLRELNEELRMLNEGWGDLDFEDRESHIDHRGELVGIFSDNVIAGAKLAYEELQEAGVPVDEPNFNSDGDVLFIIDNESESSREWISYYYDNEIAKRENWKNPKISDFVADTLAKYNLYADWQDIATLEIKSKDQYR